MRDNSRWFTIAVLKLDRRASRTADFGRSSNVVNWSMLFLSIDNCEEMLDVFHDVISKSLLASVVI